MIFPTGAASRIVRAVKFSIDMLTRRVSFDRWRSVYNSQEFNDYVRAETRVRDRTIVSFETLPSGQEKRRLRVVPDVNLPGPVRKLVGDSEIVYHEITVYDPKTRTARLDIETEATDKVKVGGDVRYILTDDSVRVQFDGEVSVSVFGVGGIIERFIANEVKQRYASLEKLLQEYVDSPA